MCHSETLFRFGNEVNNNHLHRSVQKTDENNSMSHEFQCISGANEHICSLAYLIQFINVYFYVIHRTICVPKYVLIF